MAEKKKHDRQSASESSVEGLRRELLAMVEKIPQHQIVWMISAAQEHFIAKIETQELKILRAERFRVGKKENPWDQKTIAENADERIQQYVPLVRFLDTLKRFVSNLDSERSARDLSAYIRSRQ